MPLIYAPSNKLRQIFKASGILFYRHIGDKLYFLFQCEERKEHNNEKSVHFIGGKRENFENAMECAVREFCEETDCKIKPYVFYNLLKSGNRKDYWFEQGKYILYIDECPRKYYDIDVQFNVKSNDNKLYWISLDELLSAIQSGDNVYVSREWKEINTYKLSYMTVAIMKELYMNSKH